MNPLICSFFLKAISIQEYKFSHSISFYCYSEWARKSDPFANKLRKVIQMQRGKRAACFKTPASPNKDAFSLEMWQMCCKCHLCLLPHVSQANYMVNVARLPMRQLWDRYNYVRWRQQRGESTSSTVIIHKMDHIFASNNLMSTRVCISAEITGSNKTLKPSTSHDHEPHTHSIQPSISTKP